MLKQTQLAGVCSISLVIQLGAVAITTTGCSQATATIEPKNNSSQSPTAPHDRLYQYSVWCAFVNRIFDGEMTVKQLQAQGDTGLGGFDFLDGELVMLDGVTYRIVADGTVSTGKTDDEIVFADVVRFQADQSTQISTPINYDQLRARVNDLMTSKNYFYAFKIHGTFKRFKCGSVNKQHQPFEQGLDTIIPNRPKFETSNVTGTLVGFYCPDFSGEVAISGLHLHFISDDHQFGGHVLEFESAGILTVEIDRLKSFTFELPENPSYANVTMDAEFQYMKK